MQIEELLDCRNDIINDAKDEDGYVTNPCLLYELLPSMLESKLIDSDDYSECYHEDSKKRINIDGYMINESGERLQVFMMDKKTADQNLLEKELLISERNFYEKKIFAIQSFFKNCMSKNMVETLQDSSPIRALVTKLNSIEGIKDFDVIEIFLISLTATVSFKGATTQPKDIYIANNEFEYRYNEDGISKIKSIMFVNKVIDLNFILRSQITQGKGEPLEVKFDKIIGHGLNALTAADEERFESYLCVLPAKILINLYTLYSTRLLEKNVRSFLQFKGVNAGIKKTIKEEPEKFIAYNNGLTITATSAKISNKKGGIQIQSLTDFQIVNGGQTTASIYFASKEGLNLDKVKVMAKINVAKENNEKNLDQLIRNISEYSNAQSRVSKVDLRSREPQLIQLKKMSNSTMSPTGKFWFFERAKGDYHTQVRFKGKDKMKEYPPKRRFSKELLAKYYSAWGNEPFKVKKGGEKIFRHFIEELSNGDLNTPVVIDREFYENTISKIILFRDMEKIYGQGKNAMGQLRSAVIPYSLSVLFTYTDATSDKKFDMGIIWKNEGLKDDLSLYFEKLMSLINDLIKVYSKSEDYGEYSKKKDLWDDIRNCKEIRTFMTTPLSFQILKKYSKPKELGSGI